jgi:hypothetical protein
MIAKRGHEEKPDSLLRQCRLFSTFFRTEFPHPHNNLPALPRIRKSPTRLTAVYTPIRTEGQMNTPLPTPGLLDSQTPWLPSPCMTDRPKNLSYLTSTSVMN